MAHLSHHDKVEHVAAALRARRGHSPLSLHKRAVSHEVPKRDDAKYGEDKLDVRALDSILSIDVARRRCVAEPGVTFADLVDATLPYGLAPMVVPELKTITIGGAVAGCSLESTSFRFGGFHDTCTAYEVITGRGEILRCAPDGENALLFQMMHGSFGTLGVLSQLEFSLMPAAPYVHVVHERYTTWKDYRAAIWQHFLARDVDFVDGFIHGPDEFVLSVGRFVDDAPYTHRYDWTRVYYQSTRQRREDFLRTAHYFFRYDRGVTNVHPRTSLGRALMGPWWGSAQLLRAAEKLHHFLPGERPPVNLDVFLPLSRVEAFLDWYQRRVGFYPLWCVPYHRVRRYEWLSEEFHRRSNEPLFIDLALYGLKPHLGDNPARRIEQELLRIGGLKTLISHNYFSEAEFWSIWNPNTYARVKQLVDPDHVFRDLYDRTCRAPLGLAALEQARD